jgi:hypothetical protein
MANTLSNMSFPLGVRVDTDEKELKLVGDEILRYFKKRQSLT